MYSIFNHRLRYDCETGKFYWKIPPRNSPKSLGEEAGSFVGNGYGVICIDNKRYSSHKVVWCLYYKEWPDFHIDHINGLKNDNRICNLRKSTPRENMRNRGLNNNNTSGYSGIQKSRKKWRVRIRVDGKLMDFGSFESIDEAIKIRDEKYLELGFSCSHGKRNSWGNNEDKT
ncbi:MAG: Fis family transcriptional regulator [Idiomarinaceae bacterium]|nr:Fis family transcriptional regulator [Idiomarinaceae bacterium]MBG23867.1 Fis family transcriptional regulator [Idiomarinaceae bacterium]|tara:strand:- start:9411 stop:9926 length:516 start_codon:yes stop_codon:yes gene_type:complete